VTGPGIRPLLILSDIDGTLLGEEGLPVTPVELRQGLVRLEAAWRAPVQLGLASSRTLREITVLQRALGIPGPCIAEDGALWAVDSAPSATASAAQTMEQHGRRRLMTRHIAATAETLREHMAGIEPFYRADTRQRPMAALRELGFRTPASARRALHARRNSVLVDPLVLTDSELDHIRTISDARGLQLRRGGRWFTLTSAGGKGPALCALRHHFTDDGVSPVIAAIGNEENDVSLLAEADLRFVIRNPHRGPHPALAALPEAIVLEAEGPGGWMQMLDLLTHRAGEARS
jgi:mannosyl-3-phosphoglycerate phosphatase